MRSCLFLFIFFFFKRLLWPAKNKTKSTVRVLYLILIRHSEPFVFDNNPVKLKLDTYEGEWIVTLRPSIGFKIACEHFGTDN